MEGIVNEVLNPRKTCGSIPTYIVNAAREVTTLRRPYSLPWSPSHLGRAPGCGLRGRREAQGLVVA
jgi:hypothetical protein